MFVRTLSVRGLREVLLALLLALVAPMPAGGRLLARDDGDAPEGAGVGDEGLAEGSSITVSLERVWSAPGLHAEVPVSIESSEGLNVIALSVEFPAQALELAGVELRRSVANLLANRATEESTFSWEVDNDEGWVQILLVADYAGREDKALPSGFLNGIFTLEFAVGADVAPGEFPLVFTMEGEGAYTGTFTVDGEPVYNRCGRPAGPVFRDEPARGGEVPGTEDGLISVAVIGDVGIFVRGDANRDEIIDVSDPVRVLAHLFLNGAELPCPPAADANEDREIDLADSVTVLGWLFTGSTDWRPSVVVLGPDEPDVDRCTPSYP